MKQLLILLALASLLLAACGTPAPGVEATTQTGIAATQVVLPTDTPAPTQTVTPTETPKPLYTLTVTSLPRTATPELYTLSVLTFHDYNGNGAQDYEEPALAEIVIATASFECTTGDDGRCDLDPVPTGRQVLGITDERDVADHKRMRYIFPSVSTVENIKDGLPVTVNGDVEILIPLGIGYLTSPLDPSTHEIFSYFDHSIGPGVRDFKGNSIIAKWPNIRGTLQDHRGLDYECARGEPIYAAAPGIVVFAGPAGNQALHVGINHLGETVQTGYGHLDEIQVQLFGRVNRGDVIGTCGSTGSEIVHLHFQESCLNSPCFGRDVYYQDGEMDPFRDVNDPDSLSSWISGNNPTFFRYMGIW